MIKTLERASITDEQLKLLLVLSPVRSEDILGALGDHLLKDGRRLEPAQAAALNGVPTSNLTRAIKKLQGASDIALRYGNTMRNRAL